jgi:hypothetical protein
MESELEPTNAQTLQRISLYLNNRDAVSGASRTKPGLAEPVERHKGVQGSTAGAHNRAAVQQLTFSG